MPASQADSATVAELESLMRELPEWKNKFPDAYNEINPPRYSKINRKGRAEPTEKQCKHRASTVPVTDYQGTYKGHYQRPRSTKRPPPSPRDLNPPPMTFQTNQRLDFVPKDINARPDLVKMEETYEAPKGPVESKTNYMRDYPGHFTLPKVEKIPVDTTQGSLKKSTAKFASQTTTKEHYRQWAPEPNLVFGELPSFTDSIIYPGQNRHLETTTKSTFKGRHIKKPEMATIADGNIKLEGSHDMATTHDLTYQPYSSAKPAERAKPKDEKIAKFRTKFDATTQFQKDFPHYQGHQPPRPADPAPSTIRLQYDYSRSFETEQKKQYPGIDVKSHPVAQLCKKDDDVYRPPEVKFHTETNQKNDYKPIDVTQIYKPPAKQPSDSPRKENAAKFDGRTMNNDFFKRWEIQPRPRYGDFHEGHTYIPPTEKFQGVSTTKDTFVPKKADVPVSYKPDQRVKDVEGERDFNTMYSTAFVQPNSVKNLSKSQANELLRELRKMKESSKFARSSRPAIAAK